MSEAPSASTGPPLDPPPPSRIWLVALRLLPFLALALWLGYFALGWTSLLSPAFGVTIAALLWIGREWL